MGTLYIVASPIGNLKDITARALEILGSVNYILCEDTRITGRLLNHYGLNTKMVSIGDFNEQTKIPSIIRDLLSGNNIALASDAGTPLISDPGFKLIREAIKSNVRVEAIPGPTAAISALTVSGLPPDKFLFLGYLPKKPGKRKNYLQSLFSILKGMGEKDLKSTVIIYESPYRLLGTLKDLSEVFGDVDIVICRELTKLHEEVRRETVSESIKHFSQVTPKGEFTILF
ncbi:16S rRNA (cytidine(1402)-2'-O)-methyltransferase [Candidatus Curtissbacteria bacterium RBG_13_40_7]|uniref:Ribosomal RNA small subunit methyltransferase I n=1 Tax=Candidatus Curtissbacteria bacterium RBG_13_40_7 TaxID=1797706 RepID=A0A1F5FXK3_9BACT|nr:MAG: 16S rRNA (cytidine(1402)-2'-O)-methyltransferase [Candidatus Curtissbacteria bacterium RBG_13_40_7]